jgi:hypothetical protein
MAEDELPETDHNPKRPNFRQMGSTGLPVWHGRVYDEKLRELEDGDRARKVYRQMADNDPVVGGILLGIELLARQVQWVIKPAEIKEEIEEAQAEADKATQDQEPEFDPNTGLQRPPKPVERKKTKSEEIADFVDECLTDMTPSWGMTLSEILSMLPYGWSWFEILYKRRKGIKTNDRMGSSLYDDGKIGWAGWSIRAQETHWRWEYENNPDGSGNLIGMTQQAPPHYREQTVPRWKSLHFTTQGRKENPEGRSILRNAYRSWYFKNNIEKIEGIGVERDLAGLPVLWAPQDLFAEDASDADKALLEMLKEIVTAIKRDEQEGVVMPMAYDDEGKNPLYKLELLSTGGDRQFDTNAIINRYNNMIAMSMMADFLLMGHENTGSYALSSGKMNMFSNALSAFLDVIVEEINLEAIPRLLELNGWDLKYSPVLQHGKLEANDLKAVAEYLRQLNAAGMSLFPNKELEIYLLEAVGLPADPGAGASPGASEVPGLQNESLLPPAILQQQQAQAAIAAQTGKIPQIGPGGRQAKTGKDGDVGDLPTPRRPMAKASQKVAASEGKKPRHFVPLAQRVAKVAMQLKESLDEADYVELLMAAAEAGQFSRLPAEMQESILQAEAEG